MFQLITFTGEDRAYLVSLIFIVCINFETRLGAFMTVGEIAFERSLHWCNTIFARSALRIPESLPARPIIPRP